MLQLDTYQYLDVAIGGEASGFRPPLYSLLLRGLLVFDNLIVVTIVQHLAAIAAATLLYILLRKLRVGSGLSALGVAPLLLDGYHLNIEHYILAEAFFGLLLIAGIFVLVHARTASPMVAMGAGLLVGLVPLVRFVGLAVLPPVLLYAFLRRFGWVRVTALALGAVLPLLVYATSFRDGSGLTDAGGFVLYGRVVSFADCAGLSLPAEQERFCVTDTERPDEPGGVWTSGLPVAELREEPGANEDLTRFGRAVILAQPLDYARVVARDYVKYFSATSPQRREPNVTRWRFVRDLEEADPHPTVARFRGSPPPSSGLNQRFTIVRGLATFLRNYQSIVYTYGPLLALFALVALAGSVLPRSTDDDDVRPEVILLTLSGLALLLLPTMTAVYHYRYVLVALPLLPPAAALAASRIWARRETARRPMRPTP